MCSPKKKDKKNKLSNGLRKKIKKKNVSTKTILLSKILLKKTNVYTHIKKDANSYIHINNNIHLCKETNEHNVISDRSLESNQNTISEFIQINTFRECLSKQDKIRYDQKMDVKKNVCVKDIIEKNQKVGQQGQLQIHYRNKKLVLEKKCHLKYITTKLIKDINPLKEVRISDYVFPLNSSVLSPSNDEDYTIGYKIFQIKRLTELIYKPEESQYIVKMEERHPGEEMLKGHNRLFYFIDWLYSLGNHDAVKLCKALENYMKSQYKSGFLSGIIIDRKHLHDLNIYDKYYLSKLSDETKKYINHRPYFQKVHSVDIKSNQGTFREYRLNEKWCKQIGGKCNTKAFSYKKDDEIIGVANAIRTSNWMEQYASNLHDVEKLTSNLVANDVYHVQPLTIYLRNVSGKKIPGRLTLFRESYMLNFNINYCSILVYDCD